MVIRCIVFLIMISFVACEPTSGKLQKVKPISEFQVRHRSLIITQDTMSLRIFKSRPLSDDSLYIFFEFNELTDQFYKVFRNGKLVLTVDKKNTHGKLSGLKKESRIFDVWKNDEFIGTFDYPSNCHHIDLTGIRNRLSIIYSIRDEY